MRVSSNSVSKTAKLTRKMPASSCVGRKDRPDLEITPSRFTRPA
jgi:hypothetical protein